MKKIFTKLFQIFLPLLLGSIVGFIITNHIDYNMLTKPPLSPPNYLFPVAWTILYLLMGISYCIFKNKDIYSPATTILYYLQLFLNITWSLIFFVLKWRLLSIIWIILLILVVLFLMKSFYKTSKISYYLLIPYLLWILFAAYLNIGIYLLN